MKTVFMALLAVMFSVGLMACSNDGGGSSTTSVKTGETEIVTTKSKE